MKDNIRRIKVAKCNVAFSVDIINQDTLGDEGNTPEAYLRAMAKENADIAIEVLHDRRWKQDIFIHSATKATLGDITYNGDHANYKATIEIPLEIKNLYALEGKEHEEIKKVLDKVIGVSPENRILMSLNSIKEVSIESVVHANYNRTQNNENSLSI